MADEVQKVDLDSIDSSMVDEDIVLNPDVNPLEGPPPADDGVYRVKLVGGSDWASSETKVNKAGESRAFLKTQFQAIILDEGSNMNKRLFGRVNTLSFEGKNEMGFIIMNIMGGKDNPEARAWMEQKRSFVDLAKEFQRVLAGEPILKVRTKWIAQYKESEEDGAKYKTALSGQSQFPKGPDGKPRPVVVVRGHGEVKAQATIQDYFPA